MFIFVPVMALGFTACDQLSQPMVIEPGLYEMAQRLTMTELVAYNEVIVPATDKIDTVKICISDPKYLMGMDIVHWAEPLVGLDCDVERSRLDSHTLRYKKTCRFGDVTQTSVDTMSIDEERRGWNYILNGKAQTASGDVDVNIVAEARRVGTC